MSAAEVSDTHTSVGRVCRMDSGTRGVTGPCSTSRVVSRCHELNEPPTLIE